MVLNQELFDRKVETSERFAKTQQKLSDEALARMLAVQLLDNSLIVGENFEFNESEISGATRVLWALMNGMVTVEITDEQDIIDAAFRETTVTEVLRRIHGKSIGILGVTMPGIGANIDG